MIYKGSIAHRPTMRRFPPPWMLWKAKFKSRVNAFRHMGSWYLLALAFTLCTSLAVAEEGQQVPKTQRVNSPW
jgi:hypothetical protein